MKSNILSFVLFLVAGFGSAAQLQAQTIFTSNAGGGKWGTASTWTVSGDNNGHTFPTNPTTTRQQEASNEVIIINSPVVLDQDYSIGGKDGMLTITSTGSLIQDAPGRTLSFGSQSGPDKMRLVTEGRLEVSSLTFYKADADINAPLEVACSITLANQSTLNIDSRVEIAGNLILLQGNPSIISTSGSSGVGGELFIDGCVMTQGNGRGLVKDLFDAGLSVCIKGQGTDCGVADIPNLTCNQFASEYIAKNACGNPLPVQLVSFKARNVGRQVQLDWATAQELNSASFAVERSLDGRAFQTVATVKAAGNSSVARTYTSIDATPNQGTNYYRLRQTDLDGTVAYSQVVAVDVNIAGARQEMAVYGTPTTISVDMQTAGTWQSIRVMDALGRVLRTEQLPSGLTGAISRQIHLGQSAPGGIYIVQALTSEGILSKRVMLRSE